MLKWRYFHNSNQLISAGVLYLALPAGFGLMTLFALWMLFTGKEKLDGGSPS